MRGPCGHFWEALWDRHRSHKVCVPFGLYNNTEERRMNRGTDSVLSVYSDARAEYTKQLCVFLVPAYFQFFVELLEKAKQATLIAGESKKALWQFQTYLNEIHDWNMEKVNNEIHTIYVNSGCDYLEDLLTAVFIAHTKVLTAIRLSSNNKKVDITIPKVEHFLFKVLCETSKLLWSSTYLFRDVPGIEKQQNYRAIEGILNDGILQAVRNLVPVKSILKDFMNGETSSDANDVSKTNDDEDDSDDEKESKPAEVEADVPAAAPDTLSTPITPVSPITPITPDPITPEPIAPKNEIVIPSDTGISSSISSAMSSIANIPATISSAIESVMPQQSQTIIIEDKPTVRFGQFDAVFDSENPSESDMIYDPKDLDEQIPDPIDSVAESLEEGLDFDSLDTETMSPGDYEEL